MQEENKYELEPNKAVGLIKLGSSRQEIINILGVPNYSEKGRKYLTDYYDHKRLHIDYKLDTNECKSVLVLNGAELIYNEVNLLGRRWDQMLQWLQESDPDLDIDGRIYTSPLLRIATCPMLDYDSRTEKIESIAIFTDDYWSSDIERAAAVEKSIQEMPSLEEMAKELGLEDFL